MDIYRLYAKFPDQKRYAPMNWKTGKQVINLIYATFFYENEIEIVLNEARKLNPEVKFEMRKV